MALAIVVGIWRLGVFDGGGGAAAARTCPIDEAPQVASVGSARIAGLQRELVRMIGVREALVPQERGLVPYEQGAIGSEAAWTDEEPGNGGVPARGPQPAGFEMRWWTVGRDDLVGDVFLFESEPQAQKYFDLATSTECRTKAVSQSASVPAGSRNLEWSNPFSYAQQDVYLRRGRRVYRVSVVQPGVGSDVPVPVGLYGFHLVGAVACGLPLAGCSRHKAAY